MLVLTRKPGEQLVIGNNIRVTIVSVGPGRVKIGIEAPSDVRIDRQEIHERILHEQEASSDVLAAVTGTPADGQSPTMVNSAGDTMQLHNRLTERVMPSPVAAKRPLPRKPR